MNDQKQNHTSQIKHAIVIGGAFSGLVTARILADYCEKVTVIERDPNPESFLPRMGSPQLEQAHYLHMSGANILRDLFPDLNQTILSNGGCEADVTNEIRYITSVGLMPHFKSEIYTWISTRSLLDESIRSQVEKYPNIEFLYNTKAMGLLTNFEKKQITGVRIQRRGNTESSELFSELVVDASGTLTQCPNWLETLGYKNPPAKKVTVDLEYRSRIYRWPENFKVDWKMILLKGGKVNQRTGMIVKIENDEHGERFLAMISGQFGDYPPETDEGCLEFARDIGETYFPPFYEIIERSKPITPNVSFKFPAVRLYDYIKIPKNELPTGFIAIGDALLALSPAYSLGLSILCQTANVLKNILSENHSHLLVYLKDHYLERASKYLNNAWKANVYHEFNHPKSVEKKPFDAPLRNWYQKKVFKLAAKDPEIWMKALYTTSLQKPWITLLKPSTLIRVLLGR